MQKARTAVGRMLVVAGGMMPAPSPTLIPFATVTSSATEPSLTVALIFGNTVWALNHRIQSRKVSCGSEVTSDLKDLQEFPAELESGLV